MMRMPDRQTHAFLLSIIAAFSDPASKPFEYGNTNADASGVIYVWEAVILDLYQKTGCFCLTEATQLANAIENPLKSLIWNHRGLRLFNPWSG